MSSIGRIPGVAGFLSSLKNLIVWLIVMRLWRLVNPISTSFLTLSDRCQYRAVPMGLGSTTPAVYAACQIPVRLILRVISRMSMGASRFDRSFLWMHRKLISARSSFFPLTDSLAGTPVMNATSLPVPTTLTPRCQSLTYPGGWSTHLRNSREYWNLNMASSSST